MPATRSAAEASAPGIVRPICRRMKRELTARGTQLIKPRHRARLRRSRRRMKARAASGAPTAENRSSSRTLDFIPLVREGTKSRQAKRAQPRHPLRRAEPTNRAAKKGRQPDLPRPRTGRFYGAGGEDVATSSLQSNRWSAAMLQPNDLSRSLVAPFLRPGWSAQHAGAGAAVELVWPASILCPRARAE